ncbi:hypothetical protein SAMN05192558_106283 [Actinokineospora alba]|uniref:Uncharacterized protein n=1 Tax=Actinokineospora alba TaxID=504798 RepID=A0A1H0PWN9_9PSEU|nr:DUF6191 domain-containing protein [Actinokineospora alba]TDP65958.1 hypothetical protein C8E96_1450 [Actinokineospora alba]SDI61336.1 hypothetical protein SAMN05421871_106169 [Actinokineospora alba]SDP08946.1 hypothetical protein SAMN05192558_106283 [Actinokineospora alba]
MEWVIPIPVLLLVAVGVYELRAQRWRKRPGTPISATYVNEFTAIFYGTKRTELDHRDSMSLMREDDAQGAPPGLGVDLDRGIVVLERNFRDRVSRSEIRTAPSPTWSSGSPGTDSNTAASMARDDKPA